MFTKAAIHSLAIFLLGIGLSGCATYYDKTRSTEKALVSGDFSQAETIIKKNKFLGRKRNQLLYHLELGRVQNLQGDFEASNKSLNVADRMMEEYRNLFEMAVGVTVNPAMQAYKPEGHERILVHYYKALNYLQLGNTEEALVEARRIDLDEAKNQNAVNGKKKKYGSDPFGLILMGMIYEADHDYNNAFIAYRNAKKVYAEDQTGLYHGKAPKSLEQDLVRTAKLAGLHYDSDLKATPMPYGEAIVFWENGLAPIKEEKNLFFSLNKHNDAFFFVADGISIPIDYDFEAKDPEFSPSDLGLIRLAWSYYVPRPSRVQQATVSLDGKTQRLELVEDVSALAFQIEKDNYFKELGKNLLRLSLKKISELSLSEQNEYAGLALGVANAATEKADTRNWQTLPGQIHFTRIPLHEGSNTVTLTCNNGETFTFNFEGKKGAKYFRNAVTY